MDILKNNNFYIINILKMTVKELIEKLQKFDENLKIEILQWNDIETIEIQNIWKDSTNPVVLITIN